MTARVVFLTGAARSGKSRFAEALASRLGGDRVTYVATLEAGDDEMRRRIAMHRARRPAVWNTVEAPYDAVDAVRNHPDDVLLLDCVAGWVSNWLLRLERAGEEHALTTCLAQAEELAGAARLRNGMTIFVSNEVGWGVVPAYPLGRWYRDALGLVNQRLARSADVAALLVSGLPLVLKGELSTLDPHAAER